MNALLTFILFYSSSPDSMQEIYRDQNAFPARAEPEHFLFCCWNSRRFGRGFWNVFGFWRWLDLASYIIEAITAPISVYICRHINNYLFLISAVNDNQELILSDEVSCEEVEKVDLMSKSFHGVHDLWTHRVLLLIVSAALKREGGIWIDAE